MLIDRSARRSKFKRSAWDVFSTKQLDSSPDVHQPVRCNLSLQVKYASNMASLHRGITRLQQLRVSGGARLFVFQTVRLASSEQPGKIHPILHRKGVVAPWRNRIVTRLSSTETASKCLMPDETETTRIRELNAKLPEHLRIPLDLTEGQFVDTRIDSVREEYGKFVSTCASTRGKAFEASSNCMRRFWTASLCFAVALVEAITATLQAGFPHVLRNLEK